MLDFIFTIDYEIYGNGQGSLTELVLDPMERLMEIFQKHNKKLVVFAEAAEFELIEKYKSDNAIDSVKEQIKELYRQGFEIGLHLHPQWYNAKYINENWELDYKEYNLCILPKDRIIQIVDQSIDYLQRIIEDPKFIPTSFRAGNWLFQPTKVAAEVLAEKGIKVDSSVFKGGMQYKHKLDYRKSLKNGNSWKFAEDVNIPDCNGRVLEIPIYTKMVPFWKMLTGKRVALQRKITLPELKAQRDPMRVMDFIRLQYPLKLDFCRMTMEELIKTTENIIKKHSQTPSQYCPIVSIGHTKDLFDYQTVNSFINYLIEKGINITTFKEALNAAKFDSVP